MSWPLLVGWGEARGGTTTRQRWRVRVQPAPTTKVGALPAIGAAYVVLLRSAERGGQHVAALVPGMSAAIYCRSCH